MCVLQSLSQAAVARMAPTIQWAPLVNLVVSHLPDQVVPCAGEESTEAKYQARREAVSVSYPWSDCLAPLAAVKEHSNAHCLAASARKVAKTGICPGHQDSIKGFCFRCEAGLKCIAATQHFHAVLLRRIIAARMC